MGANGKEIEKRERNVFSAAVGINVNYRFNRRWAIQSGIAYSWSNSQIDSATSYAVQEGNGPVQFKFNSVLGYSYLHPHGTAAPAAGDSILTAKSSTNLHYLTIPLAVSYRIYSKRFAFVPAVGITFGILTKAEMEANEYGLGYDEKDSKIPIRGLKKINTGVLLKADLEYHISNLRAVEVIPSFRSTLSPVNLKSALSAYPYNFDIGMGVQFSF
jgi:lipopolysaccharide assembly outer membrane protein LptD (OstA)